MTSVVEAFWVAAERWIYTEHGRLAAPLSGRTLLQEEQPFVRSYCETLLTITAIAENLDNDEVARTAWEFYEHWKFYTLYAFNFERPWMCAARGPLPEGLVRAWVETAAASHATRWDAVAVEPTLAISLTSWRRSVEGGGDSAVLPDQSDWITAELLQGASRFQRRPAGRSFEWDFGIEVARPATTVRYTLDENALDLDEVEALVVLMSEELSRTPISSFAEMLDAA